MLRARPCSKREGSKPFRFINSKLIKIMPAAVTEAKRPESYLIRKVLGCSEPVRNGRFNLQITLTLSSLVQNLMAFPLSPLLSVLLCLLEPDLATSKNTVLGGVNATASICSVTSSVLFRLD